MIRENETSVSVQTASSKNTMAKAGDKNGGGGKKGLKRKAATLEPQEAAVSEDGTTESGVQPTTAAAFPPGFSISDIKNKQRRHLMFTRWKQQQRKVRGWWRCQGACVVSLARGWGWGAHAWSPVPAFRAAFNSERERGKVLCPGPFDLLWEHFL